ncbi:MAG: hypothetical protein ABMB14_24795 [Myxococcota bacterium]
MILWWTGAAALAGDVWFTVTTEETSGQKLRMNLPAEVIDADDHLTVNGSTIDLAAVVREVRAKPEGASRAFDVPGDAPGEVAHVVVAHRATVAAPVVSSLAVRGAGPLGNGLTLTFPLDGLGQTAGSVSRTPVPGVTIDLDRDGLGAALRRAGPTVLVEATGDGGGTLVIETR